MRAEAMSAGLDWEKIKEGAAALLPFAEFLSRQTTTTVDDQIVSYLRLIVGRRQMMGSVSPEMAQGMVGGRVRDRISQRIRDRIRQRAVESGAPPDAVDEALDAMESDRPFIDWLLNGGFEKLLELFFKFLPLFI